MLQTDDVFTMRYTLRTHAALLMCLAKFHVIGIRSVSKFLNCSDQYLVKLLKTVFSRRLVKITEICAVGNIKNLVISKLMVCKNVLNKA